MECNTLCVKLVNCLTLDSIEKCLALNNIFCCLTGRGILLNAECYILCYLWHFSIKGEVSWKFDVISKPKNVCLTTETKKLVARFAIDYHPSARKLLISASGQVAMDWNFKNIRLMFFKFSYFCFQNVLEHIMSRSCQELSWFLSSHCSRIILY